jgi:DNA polymerase V
MNSNFFAPRPLNDPEQLSKNKIVTAGTLEFTPDGIDLNEQLIKNKASTYFMQVNSDAMLGAGIQKGDVVIVDRLIPAESGKIVIAVLNNEMLIRYMEIVNKRVRLVPATKKLAPVDIDPLADFYIWGVVTYVIRRFI